MKKSASSVDKLKFFAPLMYAPDLNPLKYHHQYVYIMAHVIDQVANVPTPILLRHTGELPTILCQRHDS